MKGIIGRGECVVVRTGIRDFASVDVVEGLSQIDSVAATRKKAHAAMAWRHLSTWLLACAGIWP